MRRNLKCILIRRLEECSLNVLRYLFEDSPRMTSSHQDINCLKLTLIPASYLMFVFQVNLG